MDAQRKAQWVAALRSGQYEQAHGALRKRNKYDNRQHTYCCLGVAGDLLVKDGLAEWVNNALHVHGKRGVGITYLHDAAYEAFTLHDGVGELPFKGGKFWYGKLVEESCNMTLAACNDSGCTFDQIADLIEYFL